MSNETVVVCTAKSTERILREGGTSSWRLSANHAHRAVYAVCTRNANADWVEGLEPHRSAFLVGKVSDVVPAPASPGRYLIEFSEYARVSIPDVWQGDRNPVRYTTLDDIGIDPATLTWEPMPKSGVLPDPAPLPVPHTAPGPLTIADAKKGLALTFGVSPETIEITIRG